MTSPPPAPAPRERPCLRAGLWVLGIAVVGAMIRVAGAPTPSAAPAAPPGDAPATAPAIPANASPLTPDTLFSWDEAVRPGPAVYAADGLVVTLTGQLTPEGRRPVVTVQGPQGPPARLMGEAGLGHAAAQVGVGRVDPGSSIPQVVFTSFGDCAHGCGVVRLLDFLGGTWRSVEIGGLDGDALPVFPEDLDGDGRREIRLWDLRFNYVFAAYAASFNPPVIKAVVKGQVRDASAEPRFKGLYAAYLPLVEADCKAHNNGACPAFVAAALRAGVGDAAWQTMLDSYDPAADWPLPTACRTAATAKDTPCPEGQQVTFASYPEALRWFLGDLGYLPPVYIPAADAAGPSFSCAKLTAETLKLVCATPELSAADRDLAGLYWRSLALSRDPAALQASQREFIRLRNNAPPDAFTLLRIYQARMDALSALLDRS